MKDPAPLFERENQFRDDVAKRGVEGWAAPFGSEGMMISSRGKRKGPEEISASMKGLFSREKIAIDWNPDYGALSDDGSLGFTTGPSVFTWVENGEEKRAEGRYLTVWRRTPEGKYEIVVDCPVG